MSKDKAKDAFNANARSWETKSVDEILNVKPDEDIQGKDNSDPKPKPSWAQNTACNPVPGGSVGPKRSWNSDEEPEQVQDSEQELTIEFELDTQSLDMPPGISTEGIYPTRDGDVHYRYSLESGVEGEQWLKGTNIVQLELYDRGKIVTQYNNGWVVESEDPRAKEALKWIIENNDPERTEERFYKKSSDIDL